MPQTDSELEIKMSGNEMTLDDYFLIAPANAKLGIPAKTRIKFIEENIINNLPENVRGSAKQRATKIIENYVGQDVNALSVLLYAAEKGRFDEFAEKLEKHYKESLQYVHPEARKLIKISGARRAEVFFLNCYEELGIKPKINS